MSTHDQALEKLARYGPEFHGGLSNHGPMAVEALHHLGHDAAVPAWVERYVGDLELLEPAEAARGPLRLGARERYVDWVADFERQLEDSSWRELVARWLPQLTPGLFAGATHGLLRTSHAIRALREADTPARRSELARGLGYWAAVYQPLPGVVRARGERSAAELLAALPEVSRPADGWLISEVIHAVDSVPALAVQLSRLDPGELEPSRLLAALAPWAGAGVEVSLFAHIHVLTAGVALLQFEGLVSELAMHDLLEQGWHALAAMIATWRPAAPQAQQGPVPQAERLIARALACADEHAIKLVDACVSADRRFEIPALLRAADALLAGLEAR
ncbi:DUF4243 domain-containing protein [Pseudenhygromyxa sp. WMMC2535]|uniref:questin oxidase family protein n=1 Tax=Pseudenhygromyxa sp. WMMC2535 TaxID=2712867 RepID=UPI001552E4FF|nr:questin oxidase family protein [Pseudenhygromyxa sp. WMMC2535]NVB36771.1 DUF4243 domain-containing protein [Pseudenhygromyxa sp. WMMC2535]